MFDTASLKFINKKPEIRFRVSRPSTRRFVRKMIKHELEETLIEKKEMSSVNQDMSNNDFEKEVREEPRVQQ